MEEQKLTKQIATEYYNVNYGAKMNFASYDICEKLPSVISMASLSFGILALGFTEFDSKVLGAALLIIGIAGLLLKPREAMKEEYKQAGEKLIALSKKLKGIHGELIRDEEGKHEEILTEFNKLQDQHGDISNPSPVLLSSWYAHYKLFSEDNVDWMNQELGLGWTDKIPLSLRATVLALIAVLAIGVVQVSINGEAKEWFCEKEPLIQAPQSNNSIDFVDTEFVTEEIDKIEESKEVK